MVNSEKLEKLKRLQAARKGKKYTAEEEGEEEDSVKIYDEIDEAEYRSRRRKELLQDDFVVDDDGFGYVDRGIDEEENRYYSESDQSDVDDIGGDDNDDDVNKLSSVKNGKRQSKIDSLFQVQSLRKANMGVLSAQSRNTMTKKKKIAINEFDDILGEFEADSSGNQNMGQISPFKVPSSPLKVASKRGTADLSSTVERSAIKKSKLEKKSERDDLLKVNSSPLRARVHFSDDLDDMLQDVENSPTMVRNASERTIDSPMFSMRNSDTSNRVKIDDTDEKKVVRQGQGQDEDEHENDDDDGDDKVVFQRRKMRTVNTERKVNFNSRDTPDSSPFVTASATPNDLSNKLWSTTKVELSSPGGTTATSGPLQFTNKYTKDQIVDPATASFQMFWLDFAEVNNTLVLFGKIKTLNGEFVSGMVQIKGMNRELYFLPREGHTANEVHEEIIPLLLDKYGLENIRAKPERMKYAFELPDIPHSAEYLKVLLPYETPKSSHELIPADLCSDTFYHVFGGNTNIFESFVLQNRVMGPCWLEIKNGDFTELQNASNCSIEVTVADPRDIKPLDNKKDTCKFKAVSLAVQTMMNMKENRQEVVAITLSTFNDISLDKPIPEGLRPDNVVTLVRPPQGTSFPVGLATLAKQKLPGQLRLFNNEKTLLSCFCALLRVNDPDILIGHRLDSIYLDVLFHRLHDLNVPTFSALGRRARRTWPTRFGRSHGNNNTFYTRELVAGRLICDIANEMGQSLTPKCQNWDLPEMYQVVCDIEHKSIDINYQNPIYQTDVNSMLLALQENVTNAAMAAEVSFRIQLLSLTKQLTNLAGNAWSQTLAGTRAGRNEYILLHEFTRNGYIAPDKESQGARAQRQQRAEEDNGDDLGSGTTVGSSRKAKYQGGLVFEPEKGLHKNYVLVMDFNSLYPSIIQEFNICFTTVERNLNNPDELPNVPSDDKDQGVLPRLLANLVQRRREVKKVMKTETDPHKKAQCDIRQQALKLTANSMYGCLGYVNSRFYAKPLAMLVTNKGRDILMNTRQLAESMHLLVVYGDTDSVMIDTGCDTYAEAIKIGQSFKNLVNERYKLLEIDIDNVFKKLLLHTKKKYAALNVTIDKDGKERTVLEVKGLDMKRREFCPLSKEVSTHVLKTILSDEDPEVSLQEIYSYLEGIRSKIENNEIRIDKYKINTKLSKDPKAYPNGKTMPAVQVALRMRKMGKVVKAGSVITFVITKPKKLNNNNNSGSGGNGMDESQVHVAERAYALNEVMVKGNNLVPDPEYYLEKQIFAPIERLLERIVSFDVVRLSEALGLDSKKFMRRYNEGSGGNGVDRIQPLESTMSDTERFKDAATLELHCPKCSSVFPFGGIIASKYYQMTYNGLQCKRCEHTFTEIQLTSQLEGTIRAHISLYYAGWLVCDDPTCGNVTRQISVFGKRCLNEGCAGVMRFKYSDKKLYEQLLYFDSLFDCEKNKNGLLKPLYRETDEDYPGEPLNELSVKALSEQNRELFGIAHGVVEKYLANSGRRYVNMGGIFDFMRN